MLYRSSMSTQSVDTMEYLKTYEELTSNVQDLSVSFIDKNKSLVSLSEEEVDMLKEKDKLPPEDPRKYPLQSVSRVSFSPNIHSRAWIFTGSQAGLGRLMLVPGFKQ